jgi:hypothetical protein
MPVRPEVHIPSIEGSQEVDPSMPCTYRHVVHVDPNVRDPAVRLLPSS